MVKKTNNPNKITDDIFFYLSVFVIAVMVLVAILFDFLPIVPSDQPSDDILFSPSLKHPFGTDDLGMDIFSQILYGTRTSVFLGISCALFSSVGGAILGLFAGYRGFITDKVFLSIVDVVMALPELPFMIVLSAFLGPNLINIVVAISIISWIMPAKLVRAKIMTIKNENYVLLSKKYGAGFFYILREHFLPVTYPIITVSFIQIVNKSILAEAGLAFLGLSDPVSKSWGMVLNRSLSFSNIFLTEYWKWWVTAPALTLIVFALSISTIYTRIERRFL